MQIDNYELTFSRLTEDELETLRGWRNSMEISQWMIFRKHIEPEAQLRWFKGLNPETDFYFIVTHQKQRIGLMNIKNINWQEKSGEPGGFVADKRFTGTPVPALCLLILFDFAFKYLELSMLHGKILAVNTASLSCNISLGGQIISEQDGVCHVMHARQDYMSASAKYRDAAQTLYNEAALNITT